MGWPGRWRDVDETNAGRLADLFHGLCCENPKDDRDTSVQTGTQGAAHRGVDNGLIVCGGSSNLQGVKA